MICDREPFSPGDVRRAAQSVSARVISRMQQFPVDKFDRIVRICAIGTSLTINWE
jgi:hypothetical protein